MKTNEIQPVEEKIMHGGSSAGTGINLIAHGWDDVEAKLPDGSETVEDFGEDSDVQPVADTEPVEDSAEAPRTDFAQIPCTPENFGVVPAAQFDEVYAALIQADMHAAQVNLEALPKNDRRGLTMTTLRHFNCGYLPDWVLTKTRAEFLCGLYVDKETGKRKRLPKPSPRIIVPTSDKHFNGVATDSVRHSTNKDFWKQHAGKKEMFNATDALKHDLIVVVEGEIDAMSIWQATQGAVGVVAILASEGWKSTLKPRIDEFKDKKILILLDADKAGKTGAKNLFDFLSERGIVAVNRILYDAMPAADQKEFGCRAKEVDANSLLAAYSKPDPKFGNAYLRGLVERIIDDAKPDFDKRQAEIEAHNLWLQQNNARPDIDASALKVSSRVSSPSKTSTDTRRADVSSDVQAIVDEINKITPAALESRGYLCHSANGPARPNGYICFCGSGTRANKTGALTFYETPKPHFHCFSCGEGGDILKFLSRAYGIDNRGKDFFDLIRRAADDFGISYDPAIFERKKPDRPATAPDRPAVFPDVSVVFADNEDLRGKLNAWQRLNGVIDPMCLPELKNAVEYLDSLTLNDITAEGVQSSKTRLYVALCETYDLHEYTQKFWALLKEAKRVAKTRLTDDDDAELTAHLSLEERVQLNSLVAGVDMQSLRNRITSTANDLAKSQREYVKSEKQRLVREEVQRKQAARAEHLSDMKKRLEKLKTQDQCRERDAAIRATINELCTWKHDKAGNPVAVEATQQNADWIFGSDPDIDGLVGYNEFADADEFLKSPPWSKDTRRGDEFKDADSDRLAVFLRRTYTDFGNKELLSQNVTELSRVNQFNPVKEYFKDLPAWDGKERAETLFIDWLKVEDTPFVREVTRKILLAAVARIFHPGCTFQNAVVVHGNQKIGKGYILERLGGKWYKAITDRVDDPHAADAVKITWIGEFKEMAAMKKADVDAIKEFIELPADTRRFAYQRRATTVKRHCVFFITVNDAEFLSDMTGNRRFWILHSPLQKFGHLEEVRGERLSDDNVIKQIWAEVFAKYQELFKDGFDDRKLRLSSEAEITGEEIAEQYIRDDGGEGIIRAFVDAKILPPVIWNLLSREQRRKFFVEGGILLWREDLIEQRKARGGRSAVEDIAEINSLCNAAKSIGSAGQFRFYGTEYRQHICAAEIRDECFDKTDKRHSPARVQETLKRLEGWTLGKRIGHDFAYGNQRKVYWRDADNVPTDDAPADKPTDDTQPAKSYVDDLGGKPIDTDDMPF